MPVQWVRAIVDSEIVVQHAAEPDTWSTHPDRVSRRLSVTPTARGLATRLLHCVSEVVSSTRRSHSM